MVGLARVEQPADRRLVAFEPLRLEVRFVRPADLDPFVPVQPEPTQVFGDLPLGAGHVALGVRILDAQDERSAGLPGEQPIEQRRPRAADVQMARG